MNKLHEIFSNAFSDFGLTEAIDIILVGIVVYYILKLIIETRAGQIVKGILVLVFALLFSDVLDLHTLNWLCKGAVTLGAVAILIVFQPELRRGLELMGRGKIVTGRLGRTEKERRKTLVAQIVEAIDDFSRNKTGALIVFERDTVLTDVAETGTVVDGEISEQLLSNIFYPGSPLHDGAVIISKNRIYTAGCVLPLTKNPNLSKNLGTRHRAGIGMTEHSDALVIIVSEETGIISIAEDGKLERFLDRKSVEKNLLSYFLKDIDGHKLFGRITRGKGFGKKADENIEVEEEPIIKTDEGKEEEGSDA